MDRIVPPTLRDVARVAGVSMPTVSRVLNGKVPVSAEKVEAVNAAIQQLNYRPNSAARSLAIGKKTMIGVIAHNTVRFGYSQTIDGIREAANKAGYSVAIVVVESGSKDDIERAVELVLGQPVAGVITIIFDPFAGEVIPRLLDLTYVAAVGGYDDPLTVSRSGKQDVRIPHAVIDDVGAGYRATNYLLDAGHETVHLMSIPPEFEIFGRNAGWMQALKEQGRLVPEIIQCAYDSHSGYERGAEVVERYRAGDLTAVLAGNDELALGVMARLKDEGIRVPEEVAVIGFDNQEFGEFCRPALTTMKLDFQRLGRLAFGLLIEYVETGVPGARLSIGSELIIRDSV